MLEAVFITGVDEITVTGLAQWDRGQVLKITYPSIPSAFQVHFANKNSEKAMVVQATGADDLATVAIPDELLRESLELFAWLYFDESLIGETAGTVRMPIKARTKPDDYVIELPQAQLTDAEKLVAKMIGTKGDNLEFDTEENKLYLTSDGKRISDGIHVATSGGGVNFTVDETLTLDPKTKVLSVNTADSPEADNTLPITAAAVHTTVGNIEVLLGTI